MKHKIVATLPIRDGGWIVGKTLDVLSRFCENIVVVNDNSIDNSEEVCRSYEKVDWYNRRPHNWIKREEGLQRQEMMDHACKHNPDYVLFLDCDEIPTPNFLSFMENIDESVNLWQARMVNLFGDEGHYRVDNFTTPNGTNIGWDPFSANPWLKWVLMKYDKDITYAYDTSVERGPVGKFHPSPGNVPTPHVRTEDFYVIHYGKLGEDYLSGEKHNMYAHQDNYVGRGTIENRLTHHLQANAVNTMQLKEADKGWFWD